MPNPGDHFLITLIAIVYPLLFTLDWYRRARPLLETDAARGRLRFYRHTLIELWLTTPAVLLWWLYSGRSAKDVGLGFPGGWAFWIGVVAVVAFAVVATLQLRTVRSSAQAAEQVRKQLTGVPMRIVPRTGQERRIWIGVSLTAGFCEELLYRGYLIWYVMAWLPTTAAVVVSTVVFGMAHIYLGLGGMLRATAAGAVFAVAYLLTGSLWVPIALHTAVDIASGLTGSAALEGEPAIAAGSE